MKDAKDLIPWEVTDISIRPFDGYWSFNPSIHFDGGVWRCVQRCCDYAMPDGISIRSKSAQPLGQRTKNAMLILDPGSWKPIRIYKMHERDDLPRASTPHVGYEDMRLFKTDAGGLQGIAASLHLRRGGRGTDGSFQHQLGPQNQPPEQVVLSFDDEYNIVGAQPIRGEGWSGTPQKNWVPFDGCMEPRFLYSIGKGTMFDADGSIHGDRGLVRPSVRKPSSILPAQGGPPPSLALEAERREEGKHEDLGGDHDDRRTRPRRSGRLDLRTMIRGGDMQIVRGKRLPSAAASMGAAPRSFPRPSSTRGGSESTRVMGTGRMLLPRYEGLRGGTQLICVDVDRWLGIGHEMKFVGGKKYYWHVFYLVDSRGKMMAASEPMKLASNGIEFAAGMAADGDRIVVSFGVDDMACRLGETRLSAVMGALQEIQKIDR